MKLYNLLLIFIIGGTIAKAQSKKPTLMVLPSDNWCVQRYFVIELDNQGSKIKVPNYKQAFQEDSEIGQVISKIGSLMIDKGFPLKDAEQEIKNIEQQSAEDAMTSNTTSGSGFSESPLDKIKRRAKADIILQINWFINKTEKSRSVNFVIEALDAYTSKRIASSSGTGTPSDKELISVLLQNAVSANIDPFIAQLEEHFTDIYNNGREIVLRIKKWQIWSNNLETEYGGKELSEIITDWIEKNAVKGKHNVTDASENLMFIEQIRIPVMKDEGKAVDARVFARELQKYLKAEPFNIESKLMIRGLGEAILVLGEK
jgi:hypothetical protein